MKDYKSAEKYLEMAYELTPDSYDVVHELKLTYYIANGLLFLAWIVMSCVNTADMREAAMDDMRAENRKEFERTRKQLRDA